jgi:aryl-alcohol dehydrogenase-like predicted oxidoreductase
MNYRTLGKTGIQVSEIGYGAWGIGGSMWYGARDEESLRALHHAADLGLNFIDTAYVYGNGHSEDLIGRFLKERKEKFIVASKIPPKNMIWPAKPESRLSEVFPYHHIVQCTEESLKRLGTDVIDIQQLHVWNDDWTDIAEWFEAVSALKAEGKIRHIGISINDHQPDNALLAVRSGRIDTVQVIYNIFDQTPGQSLFPLCESQNVGVIVRVPFDEGSLTGSVTPETNFPVGDFRNRYFRGDRRQQVHERIERIRPLLGNEAGSLAELALRFCLQPSAVSTVIPGMRSSVNVDRNCTVSDGQRLSPTLLAKLREHAWDRNFYA